MALLYLREIKVNVMKIRVPGPRGRVTALKGQNKLRPKSIWQSQRRFTSGRDAAQDFMPRNEPRDLNITNKLSVNSVNSKRVPLRY
jgi:hypothetical protein